MPSGPQHLEHGRPSPPAFSLIVTGISVTVMAGTSDWYFCVAKRRACWRVSGLAFNYFRENQYPAAEVPLASGVPVTLTVGNQRLGVSGRLIHLLVIAQRGSGYHDWGSSHLPSGNIEKASDLTLLSLCLLCAVSEGDLALY